MKRRNEIILKLMAFCYKITYMLMTVFWSVESDGKMIIDDEWLRICK